MMQNLEPTSDKTSGAVSSLLRGMVLGVIAVVAIAVWAINLECMIAGRGHGGIWATIVRIILCDAIPLATLFAIYKGIGSNEGMEQILRGVIAGPGRVLRRRPPKDRDGLFDHFES